MTNTEINERATTIGNLALAAATIKEDDGARLLIMQIAAHMANSLTKPAPYLMDMSNGKVIPFTGGKP